MSFFKELSERIGDYTLTLTITKDKGQLVVMLVPKLEAKKDDALKEIIPLTVKGTPDQLDAGFILAISQGVQMTTGLQTNIREFEASLKKAEKKVKGKDEKKDDKKPETKTETTSDDDDDDNFNDGGKDDLPFGDDKNVDKETGEVTEPEPKEKHYNAQESLNEQTTIGTKESATKPKSVEPKAKEPKPKEEKKEPAAPAALSGELKVTEEDEW